MIEATANHSKKVLPHPIKPAAHFGCSQAAIVFELSQLVLREGSGISFVVMLSAKSYHSGGLVVLAFSPGRIEVVPTEVRVPTPRDWASKADLAAELTEDFNRRGTLHH